MRKISLLLSFIALFLTGQAQVLNQSAAWPNSTWVITGTYTPAGLTNDPTIMTTGSSTFTFDDDIAGSGSVDFISINSPIIDLTAANTAGETFINITGNYIYRALGGDLLTIEYWDADAALWVNLQTFSNNDDVSNNYKTCSSLFPYTTPTLDISGFTATQLAGFMYRISYDDVGGFQWGSCFDSPTIISSSCLSPTSITATSISGTSTNLGWIDPSGTSWDIEWASTGFTQGTGTIISGTTSNPYSLTMLTPNTSYDFYVRSVCSPGDTSSWVGPVTFTTICSTFNAPWTEDFENGGNIPSCWNQGAGNSENWLFGTSGGHVGNDGTIGGTTPSGNNFAWVDDSSPHNSATTLESPPIDVTALTTPALSFYLISNNEGNTNVDFSIDIWDGAAWNTGIYTSNSNTINGEWEQIFVDLSALTITGPIQIRFIVDETNGSDFYDDVAIDDISIIEAPTCFAPTFLTTANITATSADLGWTENNSATSWEIEWAGTGFTPGTGAIVSATTNPHNLTMLIPNTTYDFYVRSICGAGDTSAWASPVTFTTPVTCLTPTALNISNLTTTSVDLGWTENNSATSWDIEWAGAGFTQGTGAVISATTTNPHSLTMLTPNTTYDFYVRSICGTGDTSNWFGPLSFTTLCIPYIAPWTEDFENGGNIPSCWNQGAGNSENWLFGTSGGHVGNDGTIGGTTPSGNNFAWVDDSSPHNSATTLESPLIDVTALTTPALSFYLISNNEGNTNVDFSIDIWDGAAWNTGIYTSNNNTFNGEWERIFVDLSTLVITGPIQIRFIVDETNGSDFYDDVAIDDVSIIEAPTCFPPTALTAANITVTSADLSWIESGTATTWDIEWDTLGFTQGSGNLVAATTTNPYNLTGLASGTTYCFFVRSICGANDTSSWTGPFCFTTIPDYCAGDHFYDNGGELGNYLVNSNDTTVICGNNPGDLISITFNSFDTETCCDALTIFNGIGTSGISFGTYGGNAIPGPFTSSDASGCLTFVFTSDGSVQNAGWDASIVCLPAPTCISPSNLNASNITFSSAMISWTENNSATSWDIEWGIQGFTQGTGNLISGSTTNSPVLSGLSSGTTYCFFVRSLCSATDTSTWTGPFCFDIPSNYCAGDLFYDNGGATANYANNSNDTIVICPTNVGDTVSVTFNSFNLEACCDDLTVFNGIGTSGTSFGTYAGTTIPGPFTSSDPSGCLTFVFTSDGSVTESGWDATVNCLINTCPTPSMLSASNITNSSADLSWVENGSASIWEIEWDTIGFTLGTGTSFPTGSNPVNINGLNPNTTYCFYVRAICSFGDSSAVSGPYCFTTPCNIDLGPDTLICSNDSLILDAGVGSSYLWSDGSTTQTILLDTTSLGGNGTYPISVTVIDSLGCTDTDTINVTFDVCSGINEPGNTVNLSVFPNPNKGTFTLTVNTSDAKELDIKITNIRGQVVYSKNNFENKSRVNEQINLNENAKGIYFITVTSEKGITTQKIIVQ